MKQIISLLSLFIVLSFAQSFAQPAPGAFLGVYLADVSESRVHELKLTEARGALVGKVIENSPAAKAGLRENDVILAFDNQIIQSSSNVYMLLSETLAGSSVLLKFTRDGSERDVTVIVGERQNSTSTESPVYSSPRRLRLGLKVSSLTDQLATFFGIIGKPAVLITEVEPRTLAERAGVKAGDCLISLNGEQVSSASDLNRMVNDATNKVKKTEADKNDLTLLIVRAQKEQTIVVKTIENEN